MASQSLISTVKSLLSWERGLKFYGTDGKGSEGMSLLSWERGLKYYLPRNPCSKRTTSLLSWERGLKFDFVDAQPTAFDVAPLVGAWIEI